MKKFLSVILALLLLCGAAAADTVCPVCGTVINDEGQAVATATPAPTAKPMPVKAGDFQYVVLSDGTAEITKYFGKKSNLDIPSTIEGYTVTSIGHEAFMFCDFLKSVSIPDTVTIIGPSAFYSCKHLVSVTIPGSVKTIGGAAFAYCNLKSLTIPEGVQVIEINAFTYNPLTSLTIPGSVESIGVQAFYASSLHTVIILDGVKNIGDSAFAQNRKLKNVTIPASVTSIDYNSFDYSPNVVLTVVPGSYAEQYAINYNIKYKN